MDKLLKALFLVLIIVPVAVGDKPTPPHSYTVLSSSGQYIFVMLASDPVLDENLMPKTESAEAQRIRRKYTKSGLYLNDSGTTPLWTVSWYARKVLVSSDGIHLIRLGPWASSSSDEALTFFASGKELKSYRIKDLIDVVSLLPHSVSHFEWIKSIQLDEERRVVTLTTLHQDRYEFDVATGAMRSSRRVSRLIGGVVAIVIIGLSLLLIKMKLRRLTESQAPNISRLKITQPAAC